MPKLIRQRPGGHVEVWGPEGITEMAASTCVHCNRITIVPPDAKPEDVGIGLCHGCMGLVCKFCVGKGCRPIERWCEEEEARVRFRKVIDGP